MRWRFCIGKKWGIMMLLAIDIGNTNITLGGFVGESLRFLTRIYADPHRTEDQYAVELQGIFRLHGIDPAQIDGIAICCVVPELTAVFRGVCRHFCSKPPLVLAPGVRSGLKIGIDDPAQLGGDLAAAAVAAQAKYPLPCIICDLGTATAVSVLDAKGRFLGGTLSAGIDLSQRALTRQAAQLSPVQLRCPERVIGRNTDASIQAGLIIGTAAMLEGLAARIEEELQQSCTMIITGGRAREVAEACRRPVTVDEHLLLDGLRRIYEKNRR